MRGASGQERYPSRHAAAGSRCRGTRIEETRHRLAMRPGMLGCLLPGWSHDASTCARNLGVPAPPSLPTQPRMLGSGPGPETRHREARPGLLRRRPASPRAVRDRRHAPRGSRRRLVFSPAAASAVASASAAIVRARPSRKAHSGRTLMARLTSTWAAMSDGCGARTSPGSAAGRRAEADRGPPLRRRRPPPTPAVAPVPQGWPAATGALCLIPPPSSWPRLRCPGRFVLPGASRGSADAAAIMAVRRRLDRCLRGPTRRRARFSI